MAFTDNFSGEASSVDLAAHTPSGGTAWTRVGGAASYATVSTSPTELRNNTTDSTGALYLCDDQGSADCYTSYTARFTNMGAFVVHRATDASNYVGCRVFGTKLQIFQRSAGTLAQVGSTGATTVNIGDTIRFESSGTTHKAFINGVEESGVGGTSSVNSTITRQGVNARNAGPAAWLDNYEAGALGAGGGPVGTVTISSATPGDTSVVVTYSYDDTDEDSFEYRINGGTATAIGASPATITGLLEGEDYALEVRAVNAGGAGTWSSVSNFTTTGVYPEYLTISDSYQGGPSRGSIYKNGSMYLSSNNKATTETRVYKMTGGTVSSPFVVADYPKEVHSSSSIAISPTGTVCTAYCYHGVSTSVFFRKAATAWEIDFGSESSISNGGLVVRYPRIQYGADGRLWLFYNSNTPRDIRYTYSDNDGATWASVTTLWDGVGTETPYFEYEIIGSDIHLITSRTHSDNVSPGTSDGYYMRFDRAAGVWKKGNGDTYTLPVTPATGDVCFNSATDSRNFGFGPQIRMEGSDVVAYCAGRIDQEDTDTAVYLMRHNGTSWSQTVILDTADGATGDSLVLNERESYSFFATTVIGGRSQVVKFSSSDGGATWAYDQITGGALTRGRDSLRRVYGGHSDQTQVLYFDLERDIGTNDWTSDLYLMTDDVSGGPLVFGLAIQDATHAHATENLTLDLATSLTVADTAHSLAVDAATLTTDATLIAADTAHAHTTDNVTLTGSGGALWSPTHITTALWLDADDAATFTLSGSDITEWRDKSGNTRHATPALALKPTRTASGINSMGSVVFGATEAPLVTPSFANPSGADGVLLAIVVEKTGEPVNYSNPVTKGAVNAEWSLIFVTHNAGALGSSAPLAGYTFLRNDTVGFNSIQSTSQLAVSAPKVLTGAIANAGMEYFFDGNAQGTQGATTRTFSGPSALTIGASPDIDYTQNRFQGRIGEIVLVHGDVTTDTRQLLEGYLAHKWGRASALPSGHPYKAAPPESDATNSDLTVADTAHALAADNLILSTGVTLVAADTLHASTADNLTLTAADAETLTVADTLHAHSTDNLTLSAAVTLVVQDVLHGHSVDSLTLSATLALIISSTDHAHITEAVTLINGLALTVQDATHAHLVEGVELDTAIALAIHDATHALTVDAATLSTITTLLVDATLHTHYTDNVGVFIPSAAADLLRKSVFARVEQFRAYARVDSRQVFTRV